MSFLDQLARARAQLAAQTADPLIEKVAAIMRDKEAIGTAPLLDLLDMPKTTGNARRVGTTMRSLGFVPIKSRRLEPGGYRDTVTRGWSRPFRGRAPQPVSNESATHPQTLGGNNGSR